MPLYPYIHLRSLVLHNIHMHVYVSRRSDQSRACTHNVLGCAMRRDISERHRARVPGAEKPGHSIEQGCGRGVRLTNFVVHPVLTEGGKCERVGASSEEGQCGAHASEAPHQTDTSRIRLPATSLLHLFTCFLQTTSYVSPE